MDVDVSYLFLESVTFTLQSNASGCVERNYTANLLFHIFRLSDFYIKVIYYLLILVFLLLYLLVSKDGKMEFSLANELLISFLIPAHPLSLAHVYYETLRFAFRNLFNFNTLDSFCFFSL